MTTIDLDSESSNPSTNETFAEVLDARFSRRALLGGGLGAAAVVVVGAGLAETVVDAVPAAAATGAKATGSLLGFSPIPVSTGDAVVVPKGYTARPLIKWGDPVSDGPAFKKDGSNTAAEQEQQFGMHNDGLAYFPLAPAPFDRIPVLSPLLMTLLGGSAHGIICQNNEYVDEGLLFPDGIANWTAQKSAKVLAAHGVSIIEVEKADGAWRVVRPSRFARRITGNTPMRMAGPAAGDPLTFTSYSEDGRKVLGTLNNCAMGQTPWNTYLTCEENFNGFFQKDAPLNPLEKRYGIAPSGPGLRLFKTDPRFKIDTEPNEPNRFGWVVEIDPFKPTSTPTKRTALGRIKHEGAKVVEAKDGRVAVYMGDDQVFEYIYRFTSSRPWRSAIERGESPLDDGVLEVAKFKADGKGEWIPLTPEHPALHGWSLSEILIKTRMAADLVGATKMDRCEWIDTIGSELTCLATLTNNSTRGVDANPGVDAANPRATNRYGQIIRWKYAHDFTDSTFTWDLFALAGDPTNPATGSTIHGDKYGSPDGLYVSPSGRLWIETDVSTSTINSGAYSGFGNNQMLCADPKTKETRRFLVGPKQCEITGVVATPDETTLFVGIQHPGEPASELTDASVPGAVRALSNWPDFDPAGRPRSSLLAITKNGGGIIGT